MATHLQAKAPGTPTWVDHASPDAEAARDFYQAIFGWQYDIGGPEFGGYTTARLGDKTVAGLSAIPETMAGMKPSWGLYFATNDIQADVDRAEKLGAKVVLHQWLWVLLAAWHICKTQPVQILVCGRPISMWAGR